MQDPSASHSRPRLGCFWGTLSPLAAPDAFDALVVHPPARIPQQGRDLAIAVAAVLACEFDQVGREGFLVIMAPRRLALGRAVLPERLAGAALGDAHRVHDGLDTGAPTRGAQKFPRAASCRISFSSVRSAMAFLRRWFSVSSAFMRLT